MNAPPVQYVTTRDGYNIAYTVSGHGPPLVFLPPGFNSVQLLWRHCPEWMHGLAQRFRLISYDARGEGLSTRGLPSDLSLADLQTDLEEIIEALHLQQVILYAHGMRGHFSVRYALSHAGRVKALIWNTAAISAAAWPSGLLRLLPSENWDLFLTSLARGRQDLVEDYRSSVTREDLSVFLKVLSSSTVESELPRLQVPLLVMHAVGFPTLRQEESMKVAAAVPDARFVPIGGSDVYGDASDGLATIDAFLNSLTNNDVTEGQEGGTSAGLSPREVEVLRLLAAGKSNAQIADELVISQNTVIRHVSNIFAKIGAANRAEAAAYATRNRLA